MAVVGSSPGSAHATVERHRTRLLSDTAPVFLVDAVPSGTHTVLDGPEGRHAAAVRRLQPGEELVIADGRGAAASCVVETVQGKDSLALRVERSWTEPQP